MVHSEAYIAESFQNIHDIITRGLKISIENVRGELNKEMPITAMPDGLRVYVQTLTNVLKSHHLTEDEIAFPYFRDKLPHAPFSGLSQAHQVVVQIINEIDQILRALENNTPQNKGLQELENAFLRLDDLWHPHIRIETNEFINYADEVITVEERLRLVQVFAEHGQKHAGPPELALPFLLFNLPLEQRKVYARLIPDEVLNHLVPNVWKNSWAPMKPYLLE